MATSLSFTDPEMDALIESVRTFRRCETEKNAALAEATLANERLNEAAAALSAAERAMGDASRALARSGKV